MFDFYKPPVVQRHTAILGPTRIEFIALDITHQAPKVCIVDTLLSSPNHCSLLARNTTPAMRHGGLYLVRKKIVFATRNKGDALLIVIGH